MERKIEKDEERRKITIKIRNISLFNKSPNKTNQRIQGSRTPMKQVL